MTHWKRIIICIAALAFAGAGLVGCSGDDGDNTVVNPNPNLLNPTGTIQGVLRDAVTLTPIAGAVVDIGLASAVTTATGQFVLTGVPATMGPDGVVGSYAATINLKGVSNNTSEWSYPDFAYTYFSVEYSSLNDTEGENPGGGSGSNHDTPVVNIADGTVLEVGKLSTTLTGTVPMCSTAQAVGAGWTVKLLARDYFSGSEGDGLENDATGNPPGSDYANAGGGRVIMTTTTDENGAFTFTGVEALRDFTIKVWNSDMTMFGEDASATSPADGETETWLIQGPDDVLNDLFDSAMNYCVSPIDDMNPWVTGCSPENGSDLAPTTGQEVVFTFSEAISGNAYALALTPSACGTNNGCLYNDLWVSATSKNKAGNIAHTMAWNEAMTALTVTFDTAPSMVYSVELTDDVDLFDNYGNSYNGDDTCTFSTNGAAIPAAVTDLSVTNTVDYDGFVNLDWSPVSGAKEYNLYCTEVEVFGAENNQSGAALLVGSYSDSNAEVELGADLPYLVETCDIPLQYECYVVGVNSDGLEGALPLISNEEGDTLVTVTVADVTAPAAGFTLEGQDLIVDFGEPMGSAAGDAANYTVAAAECANDTDVQPTVASVSYTCGDTRAVVTLAYDLGEEDIASESWTLTVGSAVTDVAGNSVDADSATFDTETCPAPPLPVFAVTYLNADEVDWDGAGAEFDWEVVDLAKDYYYTCDEYEVFSDGLREWDRTTGSTGTDGQTSAAISVDTERGDEGPADDGSLVENGNIPLQVDCTFYAVNKAGDDIAMSEIFTIADQVLPELDDVEGAGDIELPGTVGDENLTTLTLYFSEPMQETGAEVAGNYSIVANGDAVATDVIPTVVSVTYNNDGTASMVVSVVRTAALSTYSGNWTLTVADTGVVDVAGNTMNPDASSFENGFQLAPEVTWLNEATGLYDWAGSDPVELDWAPTLGPGVSYRVYKIAVAGGVTQTRVYVDCTDSTFYDVSGSNFDTELVVGNVIPVQFLVEVDSYDDTCGNGGTQIARSNRIGPVADIVEPMLATPVSVSLPFPADGETEDGVVTIRFTEPVNLVQAEDSGNWEFIPNTAVAATEVMPDLERVDYNVSTRTVTVNVTVTNPAGGTEAGVKADWTLRVSTVQDIAGNVVDNAGDEYNHETATIE